MRIGIYGSFRNEEANIDGWLATTADADVIALNDTGSTDRTYERAVDSRAFVSQTSIEPWSSCRAFNVAMDLLPDDLDLVMRLDMDERLQPGWRDALENDARLTAAAPMIVRPWFDHGGCLYRHTRIHSRHGFHWDLPVHEVLVDESGHALMVDVDLTIEHHQDLTKDRSGVLRELQDALAADPTNLRLLHYLGREYTYIADWGHAIPFLRAHAESDAYPEERSESCRLLGDCYVALMPIKDVPLSPYLKATAVSPDRREGWVALADLCHRQGNWLHCVYAAKRALAITERSWYFNWPFAWGARPYDLAALASWFLGRPDDAARYGAEALALEPDDERLQSNLDWYQRKVAHV